MFSLSRSWPINNTNLNKVQVDMEGLNPPAAEDYSLKLAKRLRLQFQIKRCRRWGCIRRLRMT